jgi:Family of unknown function (DUF6029)
LVARKLVGTCALAGAMLVSTSARAVDLPMLWGKPLTLEVTEVTIVAQRFDSREVDPVTEGGAWGQWINRLEAKLDWNHFTVGMRLDSAVYWNTLSEQCSNLTNTIQTANGPLTCQSLYPSIARDDTSRYQNSIYPAKLWGTYSNKKAGFEATVGDAYVQFARGLVLSMRKLDDLGVDNTIRGAKVTETKGPFAVTLVAGMANPSRVDEATGQALFVSKRVTDMSNPAYSSRLEQPEFGADQIFAGEVVVGRQSPVVATTSLSFVNRCAPNAYTGPTSVVPGRILNPNTFNDLFGYCDADNPNGNTNTWLQSLSTTGSDLAAKDVLTVAQAVEFPKLGKWGNLYIVGAFQNRAGIDAAGATVHQGSAIYATYNVPFGKKVTTTLEFKDYANFYPTGGAVNVSQVSAFSVLQWSAVPTIESITQDNMLGTYNVCAIGGRMRTDWRVNKHLLFFAQGIWTTSKGEQNATCDATPNGGNIQNVVPSGQAALTDYVTDGVVGWQSDFDHERWILNGTVGARQDSLGTGDTFIQQPIEVTYTIARKLSKTVALEMIGRHRVRYERGDNVGANQQAEYWVEGENYLGLSIAPKWVFTQGFEYSTRDLPPSTRFAFIDGYPAWLYLSLGGVYKFTKNSNIKVFLGQQRGGLKCISGVCRIFPAFEGARAELTLRF